MTDDEFLSLADEDWDGPDGRSVAWEIEDDHRLQDVPTHTALLHRQQGTYVEALWMRAYANAKTIVATFPAITNPAGITLPGVVVSIPIGIADMQSANLFRTRFGQAVATYVRQGWVRKSHSVYSADPWDVTSVLDDEPNF